MGRAGLFMCFLTLGCGPVTDESPDSGAMAGQMESARPNPIDGGPQGGMEGDPTPSNYSQIAINEIQCRGDEWVELIWVGGPAPADLTGWWLNDSADPGRRLVLGADAQLGANTHHVVQLTDAPFKLSCEADELFLGVEDQVITSVAWTDLPPTGTWGRLPNRTGPFQPNHPTPSRANRPPTTGTVQLNEIQCRGTEWVELYTAAEVPLDLTGWRLTDDMADPSRGRALQGEIPAGGFLVVDGDALGFGLGCGSDVLALVNAAGDTVDTLEVPDPPAAYTFGRVPDGVGTWVPTVSTREAPNEAPTDAHALLDPNRVVSLRIQLAPEARARLLATPRTYVDAQFEMEGYPVRTVGVRLKGRYGSFRPLNEKPALKVKFTHDGGDPFLGLKKIALNNFAQDPSTVAEWAAYSLFRAMGVAAPRVGYGMVSIDDELKGLYATVESMDDVALDRWFSTTHHLYEGAYGQDLFPQVIADFEIDEGSEDQMDLATLVSILEMTEPAQVYAVTAEMVDWPEVLAAMATEIFIGHWDGYAPTRNNYFLHFDDNGRLSLLPWGTDQTFRDNREFHFGQGRLLTLCFASLACRAAYDATLVVVADRVDEIGLVNGLDDRARVLAPFWEQDPFGLGEVAAFEGELEETKRFLADRQAQVRAQIECLSGADRDADGDGFDCAVDCDDGEPTIHPEAEDVCGDGVDQDCNGWADDGPRCPDCVPVTRDTHQYLVCTTARTWEDAQAHCQAQGAQMAVFEHPAEATSIARAALNTRWQPYWIGLTDREQEGVFVWVDGQPLERAHWAEDQPNQLGETDCVVAEADGEGRWNDTGCDEAYAVICESPCDAVDTDGDGYTLCTGDCKEGDRTIGPQRDELCGNENDEDCDGEVEDEDTCPRCVTVRRGTHPYALCHSRRTWSGAREECWRMGYELAVLGEAGEADWLMETVPYLDLWQFWVGLTDSEREGQFRWVDETPLTYAPWAEGEPNDAGEGEDCAEVFFDGWNDLPCRVRIPFVCEAPCEGLDTDGDGLDDCGADCDDSDPEIGVECPQ